MLLLTLTGCETTRSNNGNFRGTYAGIGYTYNPSTDTFTPPPVVEDAPE